MDPYMDDFVAQSSLEDSDGQEGRERDEDAGGGLRQWVCAAFWVSNSGATSLFESSSRGTSSTPAGGPGARGRVHRWDFCAIHPVRAWTTPHRFRELQVSGDDPGPQVRTTRGIVGAQPLTPTPCPASVAQGPP